MASASSSLLSLFFFLEFSFDEAATSLSFGSLLSSEELPISQRWRSDFAPPWVETNDNGLYFFLCWSIHVIFEVCGMWNSYTWWSSSNGPDSLDNNFWMHWMQLFPIPTLPKSLVTSSLQDQPLVLPWLWQLREVQRGHCSHLGRQPSQWNYFM